MLDIDTFVILPNKRENSSQQQALVDCDLGYEWATITE